MNEEYIIGYKGLSKYFGLTLRQLIFLLQSGGIPGVRKIKRKALGGFNGGARGVWVLDRALAERYRELRRITPRYDPVRATNALLNKFADSGCRTIPELIEQGFIDDYDWCEELDRQRKYSYLHIPILMHPKDLEEWFSSKTMPKVAKKDLYPATDTIFKKVRKGRKK